MLELVVADLVKPRVAVVDTDVASAVLLGPVCVDGTVKDLVNELGCRFIR